MRVLIHACLSKLMEAADRSQDLMAPFLGEPGLLRSLSNQSEYAPLAQQRGGSSDLGSSEALSPELDLILNVDDTHIDSIDSTDGLQSRNSIVTTTALALGAACGGRHEGNYGGAAGLAPCPCVSYRHLGLAPQGNRASGLAPCSWW